MLAACFALGLLAAVFLGGDRAKPAPEDETPTPAAEPDVPRAEPVAPVDLDDLEDNLDLRGPVSETGISVNRVGDYARLERSYDGTGTIAGTVAVRGGGLPPQWTLHIEPSRVSVGAAGAETRVVEAERGAADFAERDLPMAAYRVWASADGYASRATEVALFKFAGDELGRGLDYVNIELELRPIADVEGSVLDAEGGVAEDLDLFLAPRGNDPRLALQRTRTDINGRFRFESVATGDWGLRLGNSVRPFSEEIPVEVGLETVRLDPIQLPVLASIELLVVDEYARPWPEVIVHGNLRGDGVGAFQGTTDGQGRFYAQYLVPGTWRIETTAPREENVGGRYDYPLEARSEVQKIEMIIRERK